MRSESLAANWTKTNLNYFSNSEALHRRSWQIELTAGASKGLSSLRAQVVPGVFLWCVAASTLVIYARVPAFARVFERVGVLNNSNPYLFAFCTFALCGGTLPQVVLCFGARRGAKKSSSYSPSSARVAVVAALFTTLVFAIFGVWVSVLYSLLSALFGDRSDVSTLAIKVFVDQFVCTPILHVPYMQLLFKFRNARFPINFHRHLKADATFTTAGLLAGWWFPALFPTWLVWVPCLFVVYSLPPPLQVPMNNIITIFWGIIMQFTGADFTEDADHEAGRSPAPTVSCESNSPT